MKKNKEHNRQSIRLKGYDYSRPGFYFITICIKNRECLFGEVKDEAIFLNEYGKVAKLFWDKLESKFSNVKADAFVVMPNHIHGIIEIKADHPPVRAIHELPLRARIKSTEEDKEIIKRLRRKMLIPKVVGWYKMNVGKEINIRLKRTGNPFWHRNYYEHIIRDEESLFRIREYIKLNPAQWKEDRFYK